MLNMDLPYDPAILHLREQKTPVHTKTSSGTFRAALFIIVKKCSSASKQINKMYIHTEDYYALIKRSEVLTHITTWWTLKTCHVREARHRDHTVYIPFAGSVQNRQPVEADRRLVVARGWESGEWGVMTNRFGVLFCGDGNALKLDHGDGCITLWIYQKPLDCTLYLGGSFMWILSQ